MAKEHCDERCRNSKSAACNCECGGANHGGSTRGQSEYVAGKDWTFKKKGSQWVGVHKDGLETPPVRTLHNLESMWRDGRLDKYHDAKAAKTEKKSDKKESGKDLKYRPGPERPQTHGYDFHEFTTGDDDVKELRAISKDTGIKTSDLIEKIEKDPSAYKDSEGANYYPALDSVLPTVYDRLHEAGYDTFFKFGDGLSIYKK